MTKRWLTYCLVMMAAVGLPRLNAQTVHPYGLEQLMTTTDDELIGTPRYTGLAGAMTAVGGDPSAVKINPAGLGVYRHSQFSVTASGCFRRFDQPDHVNEDVLYSRWQLSQISYVFALTHPERVSGVVSNNLMIAYVRRADVLRHFRLNDRSEQGREPNWIETTVDEYGYRHDIDLHYAMNVSNRFYWGIGATVEWLQMRQTIDRWEYNAEDRHGRRRIYDRSDTFTGKSVGGGVSAGLLVHPVQMLRIGASVESPIFGKMRETDYFSENIVYTNDPGMNGQYDSPNDNYSWQMMTPLKASAGIGLQWTTHGLLSLQYDMQYHRLTGVSHIARAGLEMAMTPHWLMELGYAYSTLFSRHRGTLGMHYMGRWLRIGLAYAFSHSTGTYVDPMYNTNQGMYRTMEHKIVFSFQWNT